MSVRRVALAIALMSLVATPAYAGDDQGAPTYYDSGVAKTPYMGWNTYGSMWTVVRGPDNKVDRQKL